ncbi:MAG: 3-oxoacid CoA-transferase subunit B [Methyloligellaceae bacterium]
MSGLSRDQIAWRAAQEIQEGWYVNLGIGMPELLANHLPKGREVVFHSENGILGMGPAPKAGEEDINMVNAGKKPVTAVTGASFFDHAMSFGIVRGRHLNLCVLGAYQVASNGDLANWARSHNDHLPAIGGAMDLAAGAQQIYVVMNHVDKNGEPRLLDKCTYPLTGSGIVSRVFTDLARIEVADGKFIVTEIADKVTRKELQEKTGAKLTFAKNCKTMTVPDIM